MIKPTYILMIVLIAAFIAVLLVMQSTGSVVPLTNDQHITSPPEPPDSQVEPVKAQVTPLLDGRSLLEDRCANCNAVQWLEKIKKTRPAWVKTLGEMKRVGARLSDTETDALLNYLEVIE